MYDGQHLRPPGSFSCPISGISCTKPLCGKQFAHRGCGRGVLAECRWFASLVALACLHLAPCSSRESIRRVDVLCVGHPQQPFASCGSFHDRTIFSRPTFPLRGLPLCLRGGNPAESEASSESTVEYGDGVPSSSEIAKMEREVFDAEKQDELRNFEFASSDSEAQEDQYEEFDAFLKSFPDKAQNVTTGLETEHAPTTGEDYIGTYFAENDDLEESQGETTFRKHSQRQREEQAQRGRDAEDDEDASSEEVETGTLDDDEVFTMWQRVIAEARQSRCARPTAPSSTPVPRVAVAQPPSMLVPDGRGRRAQEEAGRGRKGSARPMPDRTRPPDLDDDAESGPWTPS